MRLLKLRKTKTKQPNKKKVPHVLSIRRLQPDTYEFMYEYVCVSVCVNIGRASRLAEGWGDEEDEKPRFACFESCIMLILKIF